MKNSPADGVAKFKSGNATHTATSGEMEVYGCNAKLLSLAGAKIAAPKDVTFNDVVVPAGPRVCLHPTFACTFNELKGKVGGGVTIETPESVLVVEGAGVRLENLKLDGALVIKACSGATVTVNGLEVKNEGWTWKKAPADADEVDALRGFVIERGETAEYVFDTPGTYELP